VFAGLQQGQVDRSRLSPNATAFFSEQALADLAASLGPLGTPASFVPTGSGFRGGMQYRGYRVKAGGRTFGVTTFTLPDGRLEQFMVDPAE
jgi:hypothetical protein